MAKDQESTQEREDGSITTAEAQTPPSRETMADRAIAPSGPIATRPPEMAEAEGADGYVRGARHDVTDAIVPIKVSEFIRCVIAKSLYQYRPGKIYKVPSNIKEVLRRRGVLTVI
jgi:hypothetical protein